jgi:hypothetical protein
MHWWLLLTACGSKPADDNLTGGDSDGPTVDTSWADTGDTIDTGFHDTGATDTGVSEDSDVDTGTDSDPADTDSGDSGGWDTGGWDTGGWDTGGWDTGDWDTGGWDTGIDPPPPVGLCAEWLRRSPLSPAETIRTLHSANLRPMITSIGDIRRVVYSDGTVHIADRKSDPPVATVPSDSDSSPYWSDSSAPDRSAVYATLLSDGGLVTYDGGSTSAWWVQKTDGWRALWRSTEWVSGGPSTATLLPSGELRVLALSTRDFVTLGLGKIAPDGRGSFGAIGTAPSMVEGLAIASNPGGDTSGYYWDSKSGSWELKHLDVGGYISTALTSPSTMLQPAVRAMVTKDKKAFAFFDAGGTYAGTQLHVINGGGRALVLDTVDESIPRSCLARPTADGVCTLDYETLVPVDVLDIMGDAAYLWLRTYVHEEYTAVCATGPASGPVPPCVWTPKHTHKQSVLQGACHSDTREKVPLDLGPSAAWAGGASLDGAGNLILATYEDATPDWTADSGTPPAIRVVYRTAAPLIAH